MLRAGVRGVGVTYEAPLSDTSPWAAALTLEVVTGRMVVTDLRLKPRVDLPPGTPIPDGGITTSILRQVRVAELVEEARAWAREAAALPPTGSEPVLSLLREAGNVAEAAPAPSGPSRRPDEHYLGWAVAYVHKLEEGSHAPVSEIARERDVPRGLVRDRLHVARRRGLLTNVPEGARIGGQLTQYAKELLAEQNETHRREP